MKLRLPLSLLGAVLMAPGFSADVTSPVTGDVIVTDSQTFTDVLWVGDATGLGGNESVRTAGNLTFNLGENTFSTVGLLIFGDTDKVGSVTLNSGTLNITGDGTGQNHLYIGRLNSGGGERSDVAFLNVNGGTINALESSIILSRWSTGGTLNLNAGTIKTKGINYSRPNKGKVNVNGGRLEIGSSGVTAEVGDNQFNFTKGVIGSLDSWAMSNLSALSTGDTQDNPTFDISTNHIVTINPTITGAGGSLIKDGTGTLVLANETNTNSRNWEIRNGTLFAKTADSLGTSTGVILVQGTSAFKTEAATITRDFQVSGNGTFMLAGQKQDGTVADQVTNFTGLLTMDAANSLTLERAAISITGGNNLTGDKLVMNRGSIMNIANSEVTFTADTAGLATLCIGGASVGSTSATALDVSTLNVNAGGIFNAKNAVMRLGMMYDGGAININAGGIGNFNGLNFAGYNTQMSINGGELNIGAGGITMANDGAERNDPSKIGKINFLSGTINFSETASWDFLNPTGVYNEENVLILGDAASTERNLNIADGKILTMNVAISGSGSLTKSGGGTINLGKAATYTGETVIKQGALVLGSGVTLSSSALTIYNGASFTGTFTSDVTVVGNNVATAAAWNGSMSVSSLTFTDGQAKISINGPLSVTGDITINLDPASNIMGPVMTLSGTNKLTLGGQINFLASNAVLDQVGSGSVSLQVINVTALADIGPVTLYWNRDDEKYTFDTSTFATTGRVSWANSGLSFNLRTVTEGASVPFTASNETEYVGARDPNVIFAENNTYTPYDGNTRLTNGMGNFTFQPAVLNSGDLFVLGMANGQGKVILTNNNNAQRSTKITEVTLVIDSTKGSSPITPSDSTPVGILGTGAVTIYGSTNEAGILELRTGGDTVQAGSYWINNAITLNENTGITQTGANSHRLTGGLTVAPNGRATITNESAKELIIESDIVMGSQSQLTFNGDAGMIYLNGNYTFSPTVLGVQGAAGLEITDGYTVNATRVDLDSDSVLSLSDGALLGIGIGGITGGGALNVSDSTISASASASIDAEATLGGQATFNITNAASTVTLEKGITGSGDLIKAGAGKLVVAAPATTSTTGDIIVRGGYLQLGTPSGATMVDGSSIPDRYILSGNLNVESGTLSGIIDAAGHDLTFGSGSVFSLAIDSSNRSSSIMGAGNIVVEQGATVHVNVLEQGWVTDTPYTIISSNTSISGAEFGLQLSGEYAFVNVILSQTSKNVVLTLSAKVPDVTLSTPNEKAVFPTISYLVKEALNGRRGELRGELLNEMQIVSKMTVEQLADFVTETANSTASLYSALAGQVANTTRRVQSIRNRVIQLDPYLFDQYQLTDNRNIWVEGISNYSDVDSNSNAPGYRLDTWGGTMGLSFSLSPEAYMGVGFGYMSGKTRVKGNYGKTQTDSYDMDLFGRYKKDEFSLSAVVSGGFSHVDYNRNMMFNGRLRTAEGKANGSQLMALVEAAYDLTLNESGTSILQPMVNVSTGYAKFRGFDETGLGNAGYHIDAQEVTMTTLGAGLRYIYSSQGEDSFIPARVEVRAMVTQDVGDVSYGVKANYLGASGHTMNVTGVPLERTAFHVGVSGVLPVSLYTAFFADVTGEFRDGQNAVSASVGVNFQF